MKSNLRKLMAVLLTVALLWTTVIPAFAEDVLVPEEDVIFAEPVDEAAAEVEEDLGNGLSAGDEEEQELTFDGAEAADQVADEAVEQPIDADPVDAADTGALTYTLVMDTTGLTEKKEDHTWHYIYNGKQQKPTLTMYRTEAGVDGSTVISSDLYTVTYKKNGGDATETTKDAGKYTMSAAFKASAIADNVDLKDATIQYKIGSLTADVLTHPETDFCYFIDRKPITIKAKDMKVSNGATIAYSNLEYEVTGLVEGETVADIGAINSKTGNAYPAPANTYLIVVDGLTVNDPEDGNKAGTVDSTADNGRDIILRDAWQKALGATGDGTGYSNYTLEKDDVALGGFTKGTLTVVDYTLVIGASEGMDKIQGFNADAPRFYYNGAVQAPKFQLKETGADEASDTYIDPVGMTVTYKDAKGKAVEPKNVGTYTVVFSSTSPELENVQATFAIDPRPLTVKYDVVKKDYTGEALTPDVTLSDNTTMIPNSTKTWTVGTAEGQVPVAFFQDVANAAAGKTDIYLDNTGTATKLWEAKNANTYSITAARAYSTTKGQAPNFVISAHNAQTFTIAQIKAVVTGITALAKDYNARNNAVLDLSKAQINGKAMPADVQLSAAKVVGTYADVNAGTGKKINLTYTADGLFTGEGAGNYVFDAENSQKEIADGVINKAKATVNWVLAKNTDPNTDVTEGTEEKIDYVTYDRETKFVATPTWTGLNQAESGLIGDDWTVTKPELKVTLKDSTGKTVEYAWDAGTYTAEATLTAQNYELTNKTYTFIVKPKLMDNVTIYLEDDEKLDFFKLADGNITVVNADANGIYISIDADDETEDINTGLKDTANNPWGSAKYPILVYYTGKEIKPLIEVYQDDNKLTEGVQYEVKYERNKDASKRDTDGNVDTADLMKVSLSSKDGNQQITATFFFKILPIDVVIKAVKAEDKEYDGKKDATVTYVLDNAVDGDDVTLTGGEPEFVEKDGEGAEGVAEGKSVKFTPAKLTLTGAQKDNYNINKTNNYAVLLNTGNDGAINKDAATTASITAKELTITWDKLSQAYTRAPITPTWTLTGMVDKEAAPAATLKVSAKKDGPKLVGENAVNVGTYSAKLVLANSVKNYKLPAEDSTDFTITPAKINVVADFDPRTRDAFFKHTELGPSTYEKALKTGSVIYSGEEMKPDVILDGYVGKTDYDLFEKTKANPDGDYVVTYADNINVGTATVTLSPVEGGNYDFEPAILTFDILPQVVENVVASFAWEGGKTPVLTYNGKNQEPKYTITVKGEFPQAKWNEEREVWEWTTATKDITKDVKWTATWKNNKNAGEASLTVVLAKDSNYFAEFKDFGEKTFTIEPIKVELTFAPLEFIANNNPQVPAATVTNAAEGENVQVTVTGAATVAGEYTAVASALSDPINYVLPTEAAKNSAKFVIKAAPIVLPKATIEVDKSDRDYLTLGDTLPLATYKNADGKVLGFADVTLVEPAKLNGVGTYKAIAKLPATEKEYEADPVTFEFKVVPHEVKVDWTVGEYTYNGKAQGPTAKLSSSGVEFTLTGNTATDAGSYTATIALKDSKNFTFAKDAKTTQAYTIKPYEVKAGWITGTFTYNGKAQGPVAVVDAESKAYTVSGDSATDAGSYTATVTLKDTKNYTFAKDAKTTQAYTIAKLPVTITGITANDKVEDGTNTAEIVTSGASFIGKLEKDTLTVTATGAFKDAAVGNGKEIPLTLTLGGNDAKNYTIADGSQKVTKANITAKPAQPSGTLILRTLSSGKTSLKLKWKLMQNVDGYEIGYQKSSFSEKKAKKSYIDVVGNTTYRYNIKNLDKNTLYKVWIKAYVLKDGVKQYVKTSPLTRSFTGYGTGKYTNAARLRVNTTVANLTVGGTQKITATVIGKDTSKKLEPRSSEVRYLTTDKTVAKVSKTGTITGVKAGTCDIYVLTGNGLSKKVTVTVK